jgi:hypothetical protein
MACDIKYGEHSSCGEACSSHWGQSMASISIHTVSSLQILVIFQFQIGFGQCNGLYDDAHLYSFW